MPETNFDQGAVTLPQEKGIAVRGLWEVFTSPTSFFHKLAANPKILLPWVLIGIIALFGFIMMADIIFEMQWANPKFQEQMQNNPGMTKERMQSFMAITTPVFGTLALLLSPLLVAALAYFWGSFVFGGQATFKQLLSVSLYGELLYFFGNMILLMPMVLAKQSLAVSFSPAVLVAHLGIESPAYIALSKISVFHIWEIIVLGIGFATCLNVTRNKGYVIALLSAGLVALIHVLYTWIASMM